MFAKVNGRTAVLMLLQFRQLLAGRVINLSPSTAELKLGGQWAVPFVSRCSGKHRGTPLLLTSGDCTQNMHDHAIKNVMQTKFAI